RCTTSHRKHGVLASRIKSLPGPFDVTASIQTCSYPSVDGDEIIRVNGQRSRSITLRLVPFSQCHKSDRDVRGNLPVTWIEFLGQLRFAKILLPFALSAKYPGASLLCLRIVWLQIQSAIKFSQRCIVLSVTPVIESRLAQMRF